MADESNPPTENRILARFASFFGLKRNLVILLLAIFVIGAGEELWMRFVPKYLKELGATVLVIGLYDTIRTLLGALYAYPGGVVVDRVLQQRRPRLREDHECRHTSPPPS